MGLVVYHSGLLNHPRFKPSKIKAFESASRLQALERVDEELTKGNERAALSIVKELQGKSGGLRCFGAARQVPQRLYSLDELRLNGIDPSSLLSPVDTTLGSIERNLQFTALLGGFSAWAAFGFSQLQVLIFSVGLFFLWSVDLVSFNGGLGSLVLDTIGHTLSKKYHNRVIQHEAGHFLMAYLLGVLPRGYTLSSLDALKKEGSLNVQAGTAFVDFEFLEEVSMGRVSSQALGLGLASQALKHNEGAEALVRIFSIRLHHGSLPMLNRFSCIALAGVATEYLSFGCAEGGLADINQLDGLLNGLGFTQKKADSQVRWAVLNTIFILRRHEGARSKLAEAMTFGKSVGFCIDTIEEAINVDDI